MTETPPTTDQQRAAEIRRLFAELMEAVNAASGTGLHVEIELKSFAVQESLLGRWRRFHEGHVSIKREVG